VSLELDEHRLYLSDAPRLDAYRRALTEMIRPDDVVLDLGTGTGILGMMACRAGAKRVYAVDGGPIAGLARDVVAANGLGGIMTVIRAHSTQATLPEKVSLVLTDQIGNFGFNAGLFECMADARERFLAPGGRTIPAWVELWTAPIEHAVIREQVAFWNHRPGGFNYEPAGEIARSTGYPIAMAATQLLGPGAVSVRVEPPAATGPLTGTTRSIVERDGILDGAAGWFRAGLSPSVVLTNAPDEPGRVTRRPVVFALPAPRPVTRGDAIEIRLRIIAPLSIVDWRITQIMASGAPGWSERGSTFTGLLMSQEDITHTRPDWQPALSATGHARRTVLELCDGQRPLAEIEREVLARHPDVVSSPSAAAVFVAEVVTRYAD
jgi:protein arginine N-methyltransferase 1